MFGLVCQVLIGFSDSRGFDEKTLIRGILTGKIIGVLGFLRGSCTEKGRLWENMQWDLCRMEREHCGGTM